MMAGTNPETFDWRSAGYDAGELTTNQVVGGSSDTMGVRCASRQGDPPEASLVANRSTPYLTINDIHFANMPARRMCGPP
jgi:hypothetical protein